MTNKQKSQQYSEVVIFFSCLGIVIVFIWTSLSLFWAIMATWAVLLIIGLMFLNGAGTLNKRYDESFDLFHENYQIDNGICEGESAINNEGKLIYF